MSFIIKMISKSVNQAIITSLEPETKYRLDIAQTKKDIRTQGLAVIIASNPRNPTGQVIQYVVFDGTASSGTQSEICRGEELSELVALGREGTTVILDEVRTHKQFIPSDSLWRSSTLGIYTPRMRKTLENRSPLLSTSKMLITTLSSSSMGLPRLAYITCYIRLLTFYL